MKMSVVVKIVILSAGLFLLCVPGFTQRRVELSAGFGIPEFFHVRAKYGQNLQFGVCVGIYTVNWYGDRHSDWTGAAEVAYHFLGESKYNELRPWYVLGGLGYFHLPVVNRYERYDIAFYPRIGRVFELSRRTGINVDFGLFVPMHKRAGFSSASSSVLVSGSGGFYIRL